MIEVLLGLFLIAMAVKAFRNLNIKMKVNKTPKGATPGFLKSSLEMQVDVQFSSHSIIYFNSNLMILD